MSYLYVAYGFTAVLLLAQAWSLVSRLRRAESAMMRLGKQAATSPALER